jgi:hypothetical protein
MNFARSLAMLVCAVLSTNALASLTLSRSTNVTDSLGGSLTIVTNGTVEAPGADTTSQATLSQFHPHDDATLVVNGTITRAHERSNESVINTYDGSLTVTGTDKAGKTVDDSLTLQHVQVIHEAEGFTVSGTIVRNGKTIDAAQMPEAVKHVLHRVLRLFAFD